MKRRWLYPVGGGDPVEIGDDYRPTPRLQINTDSHYDGLRATDGTPIDSRAKHRDYMKANNLSLVSDWTQTWQRAANERAQSSKQVRTERLEAVKRAYEAVRQGHKPRRIYE